jgi:hypothetical protein
MAIFVWWLTAQVTAIAVHEGGHVLCSRIASIRVILISIGVGPLLLHGQIGKTRWELRLLPFAGFVVPRSIAGASRPMLFLFLLGGVLGNALLVGFVAGLDGIGILRRLPQSVNDGLGVIVFAQVFAILINLFPFRVGVRGARLSSDGLQILRLLRSSRRRDKQLRVEQER